MTRRLQNTVVIFFRISCMFVLAACSKYPPERNYIEFEDPVEQVQDSIQAIIPLTYKVFGGKTGSFVDNKMQNRVYINAHHVGDLKLLEKPERLAQISFLKNNMTLGEVEKFLSLYHYLKRNHLEDPMTLGRDSSIIQFEYRDKDYSDFDLSRRIILVKSPQDTVTAHFKSRLMIMDRKGKLILTAPKGARID